MQSIQAAAALIDREAATTTTTGEEAAVSPNDAAWAVVLELLLNRPGDFDSNLQLQALLRKPVTIKDH